jgi:hypothetical protein
MTYDLDILGDVPDNLPVLTKPEDGELVYDNMSVDSKYVRVHFIF